MQDNKEKNLVFNEMKKKICMLDPVAFCETYLTLEGKPFRISGNGYKPFSDVYRYIGIKALEPNSKPIIMVKGRQIGMTVAASALEMYFMGSGLFGTGENPPIRIIHAFPQLEHAAAYSKTKLNQIIASSVQVENADKKNLKTKSFMQSLLDNSAAANDSLTFKQFTGGNHLWIESLGLNADRIMGRSADVIFYDECQSTTQQAIGNSLKILTTSKYGKAGEGVQVYFGTPRSKGSDFYKMWAASSQQYYYLGCEKCKQFFPLYTPGSNDWETIWIHGYTVRCPHCKHEQNKLQAAERGKWTALKDHNECKMIGFHLNQLYMPFFTREAMENQKPGIHLNNTERVYQNEVLGEFFQGDSSPITADEIREKCGDVGRKFSKGITPSPNKIVVMGLDYGQKSDLEQLANPDKVKAVGQSYSTAVILVGQGSNILSIEYALKFKRNDLSSKKGLIDQLMRQYGVQLAVGDIGYSNDLSVDLHTMYGDKYIVSRAHNKINNYIAYYQDKFPKEICFERDYYIGEMFDQLKKGMVKFPLGDYEKIAWLIDHCSSMDIKPSISRTGGDPVVHYVKGGSPNDGFMALLNAYLAYKFIITKGFSVRNPLLQETDLTNLNKPLVMSGYIPKRF